MSQHRDISELLDDYRTYLTLERNLSSSTLESYTHDITHLIQYADELGRDLLEIKYNDLEKFLSYLADIGIGQRSMARIVSGVKSFYRFLELEEILPSNPTDLLEGPSIGQHLPEVLTVEEVDAIIAAIDTSTPNGVRNAAMIELLYSCGLRASECCDLTFQSLFLEEGFIRVVGKGSKERLIPISPTAIDRLHEYLPLRADIEAKPGYRDFLFLNRNRTVISRQMLFLVIKKLVDTVGLTKEISPHTFRHSFATHLLEGGANLLAIRDMLGHASISTTEIYTHIDRTKLRSEILLHHPRNH